MDLPTCPACGQSVLDDDAEDCPFCGASMSATPSAKPAAAAPAAKTEAPKPKAQSESESDESEPAESPFEIDATATKRAVRLHPKPSKGKTHRVVCPMCDTPGFTARKAAGMDVRCANPECMMPVFPAPPLETEEKPDEQETADEQPEKKKMSGTLVVGGILAVVVIAVGVVAFIYSSSAPDELAGIKVDPKKNQQTKTTQNNTDITNNNDANAADNTKKKDDTKRDQTKTKDETKNATPSVPELTWDEIRNVVLKLMVDASQQRDNNRSKPFCRRLTSDAYAQLGDEEQLEHQINQLNKVGAGIPYFRIPGLVTLGWNKLDKNDKEGAAKFADRAYSSASDLPEVGEFAVKSAANLAALLVALDRENDAKTLLSKVTDSGRGGQVSSVIQNVNDLESFDFDTAMLEIPLRAWKSPTTVAAIVSLISHDQSDKALQFALTQSDQEILSDCVSVWSATVIKTASDSSLGEVISKIDEAANKLDTASQGRLYAGVAWVQFLSKDQTAAKTSIGKAKAAIDSLHVPDELFLPPVNAAGIKEIYQMELPARLPLETAAYASFEIAHVLAALQQPDDAWASCQKGLAFLRGMTPSQNQSSALWVESNQRGNDEVKKTLQSVLELDDDQTRTAMERFKRKAREYRELAKERFQIQNQLLMEAIDWGLLEQVWEEVRIRSIREQSDKMFEPYRFKQIGKLMLDRYVSAGNSSRVKLLEEYTQSSTAKIPRHDAEKVCAHAVVTGKVKQAADVITKLSKQTAEASDWRDQLILRIAVRFVNQKKPKEAFDFIKRFRDPLIRERAFELAAARATSMGYGQIAMKVARPRADLTATEKVALYRGVVAGMFARAGDSLKQESNETAQADAASANE